MAHHGRRRLCRWVNGWRDRLCGFKRCEAREERVVARCELGHLVLLVRIQLVLTLVVVH